MKSSTPSSSLAPTTSPLTLISGDVRAEKEAEVAALNSLLAKAPDLLLREKKIPRHTGFEVVSFLTSRVHKGHLEGLRQSLSISPEYVLAALSLDQRANTPPQGSFTFFVDQFRYGLCFPLHPIYHAIYQRFGIPPNQIIPLGGAMLRSVLKAANKSVKEEKVPAPSGSTTTATSRGSKRAAVSGENQPPLVKRKNLRSAIFPATSSGQNLRSKDSALIHIDVFSSPPRLLLKLV